MKTAPIAWKIARALQVSIILTCVLALVNLVGWVVLPQSMAALRQNHWVMSPFTAAEIFLLQAALYLFHLPERKIYHQRLSLALAGVVLFLASVSIWQAVLGIDLGMNRVLFGRYFDEAQLKALWMSPISAWLVWAGALGVGLVVAQPKPRFFWIFDFSLGLVFAYCGGIFSVSFVYGLPLYDNTSISPIAFVSAITFLIIGLEFMFEADLHLPALQKIYEPTTINRLLWAFLPVTALLILLEHRFEAYLIPYSVSQNPAVRYAFVVSITALVMIGIIYLTAQSTARELELAVTATHRALRRLEVLIDRSFSGIALVDKNGTLLFESPAVTRILGYTPEERVGRHFFDVDDTENPQAAGEFFAQSLRSTGTSISTQLRCRHKNGNWRSLELIASNFLDDPDVNAIVIHFQDITETLAANANLQRRVNQLALLNEIAGEITVLTGVDELLGKVTRLIQEKFGYDHAGLYLFNPLTHELEFKAQAGEMGQPILVDPDLLESQGVVGWTARNGRSLMVNDAALDPACMALSLGVVPEGSELSVPLHMGSAVLGVLDLQFPEKNAFDKNDIMVMETLASQVAAALENANLYDAVQKELSERKQTENALRESEFWLLESQRVARLGSYTQDFKTGYWSSSKILDEIFGIDQAYDRSTTGWSSLIHPEQREAMSRHFQRAVEQKTNFNQDYRIIRERDQAERWVLEQGELIFDSDGNPAKMFGTVQDITEQKLAENELRAALNEKEILIKEIHHRVKNNLQIVSSLLSLHSEIIQEPQALKVFQDCQNEVRAISLVHENLYQAHTLAHIEVNEYIPTLVHHLQAAFGKSAGKVRLNVDIAPVQFDLDTAIPCGLIVTELFTNAMKHAFPENVAFLRGEEQIWIELRENEVEFQLHIRDNGVGLPDSFNLQTSGSLGLQLIHLLTQQLHGRLEYQNCDGASFVISFPHSYHRERV